MKDESNVELALRTALAERAAEVSDRDELATRFIQTTLENGHPLTTNRRPWLTPLLAAVTVVVLATGSLLIVRSLSHRSSPVAPTTPTPEAAAATKQVSYRGVTLTIPAAWPVIDGAHKTTCGPPFVDQSARAFIGASHEVRFSCGPPKDAGAPTPIPADGIWLQPGGATPPGTAPTTLPSGQQVYLFPSFPSNPTTEFWYHGVTVDIGIGPDLAVEEAILNSISYDAATPDSSAGGSCPTPGTTPPALPTPTRATTLLKMDAENGELAPEPPNIQPIVSAATVWKSAQLDTRGFGVSGSQTWTMTFGSYSAQTPAHINPDNSETPLYTDVPAWVIEGKPIQTDYGPCAATIIAVYSAVTGESLGGVTMTS